MMVYTTVWLVMRELCSNIMAYFIEPHGEIMVWTASHTYMMTLLRGFSVLPNDTST